MSADTVRVLLETADERAAKAVDEAAAGLRSAIELLEEGGEDRRYHTFRKLADAFTSIARDYDLAADLAEEHVPGLAPAIAAVGAYWRARAEGCRVQSEILRHRREAAHRFEQQRRRPDPGARSKDVEAPRPLEPATSTNVAKEQADHQDLVTSALQKAVGSKAAATVGGLGTTIGSWFDADSLRNLASLGSGDVLGGGRGLHRFGPVDQPLAGKQSADEPEDPGRRRDTASGSASGRDASNRNPSSRTEPTW